MVWKPRHEAHAIERVRVQIRFKEPLTSKLLNTASDKIVSNHREYSFDTIERTPSKVPFVNLNPDGPDPRPHNGYSLKRIDGDVEVEELAFNEFIFGYLSTVYGRWENLVSRLQEVLFPPLQLVGQSADLSAVVVEYWDSFWFDGDSEHADASGVLNTLDRSVPDVSLKGETLWHSHAGWFEGTTERPILVNRNIDTADRKNNENGDTKRFLGIYTLLEQRAGEANIDIEEVADHLDHLHNRSVTILGETITPAMREKIGLNLDNYK